MSFANAAFNNLLFLNLKLGIIKASLSQFQLVVTTCWKGKLPKVLSLQRKKLLLLVFGKA